jgi:hypothetical protein
VNVKIRDNLTKKWVTGVTGRAGMDQSTTADFANCPGSYQYDALADSDKKMSSAAATADDE